MLWSYCFFLANTYQSHKWPTEFKFNSKASLLSIMHQDRNTGWLVWILILLLHFCHTLVLKILHMCRLFLKNTLNEVAVFWAVTSGSVLRARDTTQTWTHYCPWEAHCWWSGLVWKGVTTSLWENIWGPGEDLMLPGRVHKRSGKNTACDLGWKHYLGFAMQRRD